MHKLNPDTKKVVFIIALIFSIVIQNAFSQISEPSDSLKKVLICKEAEMFNVMSTGDKVAADKLIGDDYVTINADGAMQNKIEMMKTFGKFKGATFTLSDKRIRTYGNIAVITGGAKGYMKSILLAKIFYTELWIYRNGKWDFIGWHGTMTGLPSYYPMIVTAIGIILLYFIARLIRKKMRKSARMAA